MTTWLRPSFGVFDFGPTNHHLAVTHHIAARDGTFLLDFQRNQIFEVRNFSPQMDSATNKLFRLQVDPPRLTDLGDSRKLSETLWAPLPADAPHLLRLGDTLRFGKQQLVVSGLNLDPRTVGPSLLHVDNILDHKVARLQNTSFESTSTCRICLEPNTSENPFVDICLCSRQMPMHLNCVREWMKRKCETTTSRRVVFFNLSEVECEVCKTEFPGSVVVGGRVHLLFEPTVDRGRRNLVLNILDKKSLEVKGYVILYFDGPTERFTIGRTEENDVSFNELSISRVHAELRLGREGVLVNDLKSKYGTMLQVKTLDLRARAGLNIVQIDKFLFEFHTFSGACCSCAVPLNAVRPVDPLPGTLPLKKLVVPPMSDRVLRSGTDLPNRPSGPRTLTAKEPHEELRQRLGLPPTFLKAKAAEVVSEEPERAPTEENQMPQSRVAEREGNRSLILLDLLRGVSGEKRLGAGEPRSSEQPSFHRMQTEAGIIRPRQNPGRPPFAMVEGGPGPGREGLRGSWTGGDSVMSLEATPNNSFRFN